MGKSHKLVIGLVILMAVGCSTKKNSLKVRAAHDMNYTQEVNNITEVKKLNAGETLEINDQIVKFEAPSKIPVVIVADSENMSQNSSGTEWELNLKKIEEWKPKETQEYITKELDYMYMALIDILLKAKTKNVKESLRSAQALVEKYPRLSSLQYVKAQLEMMNGQSEEALKSLEISLQLNDQLVEAKNLKEKILERRKQ